MPEATRHHKSHVSEHVVAYMYFSKPVSGCCSTAFCRMVMLSACGPASARNAPNASRITISYTKW